MDEKHHNTEESARCCCDTVSTLKKEVRIEYLYLDLKTCDRCVGTDAVLDEVVGLIKPTLELAGYHVQYEKREITTAQLAQKYRFVSSPTVHVNGQDIFDTVTESDCGCCGEIAGVQVDCRTYEYDGKTYEVPTKEMLADAILKRVFRPTGLTNVKLLKYELPDNLKRFFDGKERKAAASCCCSGGGDCC